MSIYIHIYLYACLYIYIYIYVWLYTHPCRYIYIYIYATSWTLELIYKGTASSSGSRTLCCKGLDPPTWWIDPAWLMHLKFGLLSVSTSGPQLVPQRLWYIMSCLWESAYKYIYIYIYIYLESCIYRYIYMYISMYIYMYMCTHSGFQFSIACPHSNPRALTQLLETFPGLLMGYHWTALISPFKGSDQFKELEIWLQSYYVGNGLGPK